MLAIIKTGGKQYKVKAKDIIAVEKLPQAEGDEILFDPLVVVNQDEVETHAYRVRATVSKNFRAPKVIVFKKKRRHNYRRKNGHRQNMTLLQIQEIAKV